MPKIRITLDGSEQVIAQLNALGQAGANAVTKIQTAAAKGVGFEDVGRTSQAAAAGFITAGRGAEQAAAGFATSRRELIGLTKALKELQLGSIGGQFAPLIGIGARLGPIAAGVTALFAAFTGGTAAMFRFAQSAAEVAAELTKLQDVSGESFDNLSALQQAFAKGGTSAKDFGQTFTEIFRAINEAGKTQASDLAESAAKTAKAEADALRADLATGKIRGVQNEQLLVQLDKYAAKLAATATEQGRLAQQANNLSQVVNVFESLARGASSVLNPLTSMETAAKAVSIALANVGRQGGDQFQALANIIRNLPIDQARQLQQALKIPDTVFDTLRRGGAALQQTTNEITNLGTALTDLNQQDLKDLTNSWNDFTSTVSAATQKIGAEAAPQLIQLLEAAKQSALDLATLPIGENLLHSLQGIGMVLQQTLVQPLATIGSDILNNFMTNFIGPIGEAFGTIGAAAVSAFGIVVQAISSAVDAAATFASAMVGIAWDAISGAGVAAWNAVTRAISSAINALQQFLGLKSSGGGGGSGDSGVPMASGGLMGGRGTDTSDSNLAWLSRGEYITPARAVRQPGVLAFLEALRRSGGNLRGVLDDMGHFARGGLALPVPAFAGGGLNTGGSSSRVMHLTIGAETFHNLSVPESTALSLERFAVHSQIASTGRKPSWRR